MRVAFVSSGNENLGLEYLSAILKEHGYEVKLFFDPQLFNDGDFFSPPLNNFFLFQKKIIDDLVRYEPDVIGFSVVSDFYMWAAELAAAIKQRIPSTPIIFGGIHPTSVPEYVILNPAVDVVCLGEGDYALLEFIESLKAKTIDYTIKNLWFKKNGSIIRNEMRPLLQNLDSLPYPDKSLYYEVSPHFRTEYFTMAGRGCPFTCSYCYNSLLLELYKDKGKFLRRRSVPRVINEILFYTQKYKFNYIRFFDDVFAYDSDWLSEFAVMYKQKIGIPFLCYVHPEIINENIAIQLKNAGCCEVELGIQTWDEKIREYALNRFITNNTLERALCLFKDHDIAVTCDNIFGIPGQHEEELVELVKFYNRHRVARIQVFWLRYYPKTRIVSIAKELGILQDKDIEHIEKRDASPYTQGIGTFDVKKNRFQILLVLIPFLPPSVINFLISKRAYRFFPAIAPFVLRIFTNLFGSKSKFDYIMRRQKLICYVYFMGHILRQLFIPRKGRYRIAQALNSDNKREIVK